MYLSTVTESRTDFDKMDMLIIKVFFIFGFQKIVSATNNLSVQTHKDYLLATWNQISQPPQHWTLTYNVIGTNYHSVLNVPGNQYDAKIYTFNYPGVLHVIKLFALTNGTQISTGTAFGRSDCSKHTDTTIGSSYTFESFGYPGGLTRGAICTWTLYGNNDTWFRINMKDFDIGRTSCISYLNVGNMKICGNDTINGTILIQESHLSVRLSYRESSTSRGIKFEVSAIHQLVQPTNVTARTVGDSVNVAWQQPSYHPVNFTYILRISPFPFTSHVDLKLDGDSTGYEYHVVSHLGQNHSVQLQSVSEDLASHFTDPVFVLANCEKSIFLMATERTTLLTERYPYYYLPELTCNFLFQTEADFYLLILTHDLDIGAGKMCDRTYLNIENQGKFCADAVPPSSLVIKKPSVKMTLVTKEEVGGKGINISVISVAKPPPVPNNVTAITDGEFIHLTWKPPTERQVYIKGYTVQYFIAPSTPGATVSVVKDVRNISINTKEHTGRLFAVRIAGFTDGGMGNFSHPFYVRAVCGHRFHLSRHEATVISSPLSSGYYEPSTVCHWVVETDSPMWIKIKIDKLLLEDSANCSKDYVEVTGIGRLCGSQNTPNIVVIKKTELEITFRSDNQNESGGFSISAEAVGPSPGRPSSVSVSRAEYSILVTWKPPQLHRRFLTGYIVHFNFYGEGIANTSQVGPDTLYHVLDMTSYPGRLVEIWLQADGDVEPSSATNKSTIYSECGGRFIISEPTYISSPYYPNNRYTNLQCFWTLETLNILSLKVTFIRLNLNNERKICRNFVRINKESYCDDSHENKVINFNATRPVTLVFQTGHSGTGAYFLLKVEPTAGTDHVLESETSRLASGCSDIICSSTPLLMTSYLGTLLASSVLTSTQADTASERSPQNTKCLHTSLTTDVFTKSKLQNGENLQPTVSADTNQISLKFEERQTPTVPLPSATVTVGYHADTFTSTQHSTPDRTISPTKASSYMISFSNSNNKKSSMAVSLLMFSFADTSTTIIPAYHMDNFSTSKQSVAPSHMIFPAESSCFACSFSNADYEEHAINSSLKSTINTATLLESNPDQTHLSLIDKTESISMRKLHTRPVPQNVVIMEATSTSNYILGTSTSSDVHGSDLSKPPKSRLFSVTSPVVTSTFYIEANKERIISRNAETKNDLVIMKQKEEERENTSPSYGSSSEQLRYRLIVMYICISTTPFL